MTARIGHYYLLISLFLVLLAAGTIGCLLNKIKETALAYTYLMGIVAFMLVIFCSLIGEQFFLNPLNLDKMVYGHDCNFAEALLIADKVKQYTKPGDRIFVAGAEPQIYYFSQRISSSRFNMTWPLYLNTPWREQYQKQAVEDLKNNLPPIIVLPLANSALWAGTSTPTIFIDFLEKELENNYHLVGGTISNFQFSNYLGPVWVSPDQVSTSSLILYIKKSANDHSS